MTHHYVYLFHTQKFVDSKEPVYKICKTIQPNFERFNPYVDAESFHFKIPCHNCHDLEKKIIALFQINYVLHYGREYFKGNCHKMVQDICRIIIDEKEEEKYEEVVQYWFDEVVVNDDNNDDNNDRKNEIDEDEVPSSIVDVAARSPYFCVPCGYPCRSNSNLAKHCLSKKHKNKIENPDTVIEGGFKCPNCPKTYKGNTGLWAHKKVCKAIPVPVEIPVPETDLRKEINNLTVMMIELIKRQQTAPI